jgi:hypothetical protein
VRQGGFPGRRNMPGNDQRFAAIGGGWMTVVRASASVLTPAGRAGGLPTANGVASMTSTVTIHAALAQR